MNASAGTTFAEGARSQPTSTVAAAAVAAAATTTAAAGTKAPPEADDISRVDEWCHDLWGEFSNWATREPVVCADVGLDILRPYWRSNPAFAVGGGGPFVGRVTDFDYSAQAVPQFTLGVVGHDNFGFRFGWWGFAAQNSAFTGVPALGTSAAPLGVQLPALAGQGIAAASKLRFDVWDFEAFELFQPCRWSLLLSGGIRYAHLSQDYAATVVSGAGSTLSALLAGNNFNGAGPTLALCGKRPLGDSNLYVYGTLRGSILFGDGKQTVAESGIADGIQSTNDDVLPEAELELGLGWYQALGQARLFAEIGLIGQAWLEAGNSSRSEIGFGVGNQTDTTLGLFGLSMHVGVNY